MVADGRPTTERAPARRFASPSSAPFLIVPPHRPRGVTIGRRSSLVAQRRRPAVRQEDLDVRDRTWPDVRGLAVRPRAPVRARPSGGGRGGRAPGGDRSEVAGEHERGRGHPRDRRGSPRGLRRGRAGFVERIADGPIRRSRFGGGARHGRGRPSPARSRPPRGARSAEAALRAGASRARSLDIVKERFDDPEPWWAQRFRARLRPGAPPAGTAAIRSATLVLIRRLRRGATSPDNGIARASTFAHSPRCAFRGPASPARDRAAATGARGRHREPGPPGCGRTVTT
jgi:hypothetical protein